MPSEKDLRTRRTIQRQINMASVVAGGLFNAIAFAGAGYVFHKLDKSGYEPEMERHNKAMEEFNKEKEKWYERTVEKKNKIALLRQKLLDADKDLDELTMHYTTLEWQRKTYKRRKNQNLATITNRRKE